MEDELRGIRLPNGACIKFNAYHRYCLRENECPHLNLVRPVSLEIVEKEHIIKVMKYCYIVYPDCVKNQAAEILGITRATLYAKIKLYKITPESYSKETK